MLRSLQKFFESACFDFWDRRQIRRCFPLCKNMQFSLQVNLHASCKFHVLAFLLS